MTVKYCTIIFMNADEDDESLVNMFLDGETTEPELITHLSQWDMGGESEHSESITEEPGWSTSDRVFHQGDYILSWNTRLGYVGLSRVIHAPDTESITLTPWEAEQARMMVKHYMDESSELGPFSADYKNDISKMIKKLDL